MRSVNLFKAITMWLVLGCAAQAASFDCAKAQTKVEKMICSDAEVSGLDEDLAATYSSILKKDSSATSIRVEQKQWLKERNACLDAACLTSSYVQRIALLKAPALAPFTFTQNETLPEQATTAEETETCTAGWIEKSKQSCDFGGTQNFIRCLDIKIQETDAILNKKYRLLKDDLVDPSDLVKSQRSWIAYRNSECVYQSSGTVCNSGNRGMCDISSGICKMRLTCERVMLLRDHIKAKCNGCPARSFNEEAQTFRGNGSSPIPSKTVTSAEVQQPICATLAGLWSDGSFRRYSIPFDQTTPDELIYKVDIDNDGTVDEIRALCGNGAEASCEMTAQLEGVEPIEFGLPATIRLLKFRNSVYVVNGVIIRHNGAVSFSNYMVHKISKSGIELTCQAKF